MAYEAPSGIPSDITNENNILGEFSNFGVWTNLKPLYCIRHYNITELKKKSIISNMV